ncbi:AraC family transcriptional regulator [Paenibacillus doosanensis]|uniref:AraC family transcriptional regulator n=1 Tax=Paenibacillus doosanensis TaxID=1229154 RepID=UPI00217FD879|nr:AraC family transcriptional regulator [Paenibacillus doosanensis]MCS7462373.1 AraC family transcriptional regulator [Paenibacillus doosanensis]
MDILQLAIPPLPQFLTAGHSVWREGMQHFERTFEVYDLIIVCNGALYMTEAGIPYEVKAGELLLLEPGRPHYGHRPSTEDSELYWLHFRHGRPLARLTEKHIPWSTLVRRGTDSDLTAPEQYLFLPKYGAVDIKPLQPALKDILRLRDSLTLEHAVDLQVALGRLLAQLQSGVREQRRATRSYAVSEQVKAYLEQHMAEPFEARLLAEELHFHFDYAARCLKKHTGLSPLQYQHALRMETAKRLLLDSAVPVPEIASQVGFADYNYFIRMFSKTVGVSPGLFRQSARGYV